MNHLKFTKHLFYLCLAFLLACESTTPELPKGEYETGVLIINEGAFGANDGEVYHFDSETGEVETDIFENKNNRPFAGIIQNMVMEGDRTYIVANTGKVEIVNGSDFISLGAVPSGDLENTRSLAIAEDKVFVTDWGPYDENWANPESFVGVVGDLDGGPLTKKIEVPSRPEGITAYQGKILVACQADGLMAIIDPSQEQLERTVQVEGVPFSFFEWENELYLYATGENEVHFHQIAPSDFSITETLSFPVESPIYNGNYAIGNAGEVFIISSNGSESNVAIVSLATGELVDASLYSGQNFYGLGFHRDANTLYIGENNGWQGNGTVLLVSRDGDLMETVPAGRGPSGFVFP